jgi:hypothetical protein
MSTEKKLPKAGEVVELEKMVHLNDRGVIGLWDADMSAYDCGAYIGKTTISFIMPEGDAIKSMIKSLNEQIKTERANHHVKITQIEDKIQQLLAIGHDGGAA